jgi:hypothetical protein
MILTTVEYEFCANLGNYQNEKIRLSADLQGDDEAERCLEYLKRWVHSQTVTEKEYFERQEEVKKLHRKLKLYQEAYNEAAENYEKMTAFMTAQGIKSNFDKLPPFPESVTKLLTGEKVTEVFDGELEDLPI